MKWAKGNSTLEPVKWSIDLPEAQEKSREWVKEWTLSKMSGENSIVSCAVVLQYERFFISCFFTCLVTRAVHLKDTFSLSTDSFIMWLRWSIARRGKPTVINSDNVTNFELSEYMDVWNQDKIGRVLSKEEIQWVFNPPAEPQMGVVWERLVRSSKKKC